MKKKRKMERENIFALWREKEFCDDNPKRYPP